jgi:hypothetical protein
MAAGCWKIVKYPNSAPISSGHNASPFSKDSGVAFIENRTQKQGFPLSRE